MSDPRPKPTSTEIAGPPLPHYGMEGERIPERFGPYRILDILARGMALVYKAEQSSPLRTVALKIPRGGALLSPDSRKRFLREVELAARTSHAGIVPVLDAGEVDGIPYYTMPFIEGRALDEHVAQDNLDIPGRLQLFRRLCAVVQTLHAQNLVHRDLKPGNVLVDRNGDVRLLDFGLAKASGESDGLSGDHALLGTLQYMAPEQTLPGAGQTLRPAADVYALGMIACQLLAGQCPYSTANLPREDALRAIREAIPPPPSRLQPTRSRELDAVILACLRKDPRDRPQTAGDLLHRLDGALDGRPLPDAARPALRRPPRWLALAAAVVLALLAAWAIWPRRSAPEPAAPSDPPAESPAPPAPPAAPPWQIAVVEPPSGPVQAQTPPADMGAALPTRLWALHEQTARDLKTDFAKRNQGALLLEATAHGTLRISRPGHDGWSEQLLRAGQTAILHAPAGTHIAIEWQTRGRLVRHAATLAPAHVAYQPL
jgi:hypothetical protein